MIDQASASKLRLFALDVDGVLTDGRIYYGNAGEELKAFHIKDGLGIKLLQRTGVAVAIITGRQSQLVARRAAELGIEHVVQGREDKREALAELCERLAIGFGDCAYMGDDLPDLGALQAAAIALAPADAVEAVAAAAHWQSRFRGGEGAVREACEQLLQAMGRRDAIEAGFPVRLAALLLATALLPGLSGAAFALPGDRDQPIEVEADRAVRDEKRGFTTYTGRVLLTQGSLVIEAERLTIFHGTDVAERVVAIGEPARMRQQPEPEEPLVRAAARRITYLTAEERVILQEEAWVEQDGATVTGDRIDYLIPEQLVRAGAEGDSGERVQVVIPARVAADAEEDGDGDGQATAQEEPPGGAAESD